MVLRKIALVAIALGAFLTFTCLTSYVPNADAVLFGNESVNIESIPRAAMCVAPLGISFVFAIVAALAGE